MKTNPLVTLYRNKSFSWGYNPVINEKSDPTKIGIGVYRLKPGQKATVDTKGREVALVSLSGKGVFSFREKKFSFSRHDWEEEEPAVVHVSSETSLAIEAQEISEIILCAITNPKKFKSHAYYPSEIKREMRAQGTLSETATRIVRTVFDRQNAPEESLMVLGEVVNFPGRWSSYPPHHHIQPEVYFYRFKLKQGYGHGELGEEVFKVKDKDLLRITDERGHSQTSAPGYCMYYLWAVRHLPGKPYTGFTYFPEHKWTLEAKTTQELRVESRK
ncbi:MAG: 5-deoxy-glucuronate isomerase [Elusimicrobia bacterium]|nr:5-deoxy-glucuronate isomerase [Elusimicrobiota bacterium]